MHSTPDPKAVEAKAEVRLEVAPGRCFVCRQKPVAKLVATAGPSIPDNEQPGLCGACLTGESNMRNPENWT